MHIFITPRLIKLCNILTNQGKNGHTQKNNKKGKKNTFSNEHLVYTYFKFCSTFKTYQDDKQTNKQKISFYF